MLKTATMVRKICMGERFGGRWWAEYLIAHISVEKRERHTASTRSLIALKSAGWVGVVVKVLSPSIFAVGKVGMEACRLRPTRGIRNKDVGPELGGSQVWSFKAEDFGGCDQFRVFFADRFRCLFPLNLKARKAY